MSSVLAKSPAPIPSMGLILALAISCLWIAHVCCLISLEIGVTPLWQTVSHITLQMVLNTGLFITAHDAIHGLVCPHHPRLNRLLGQFCAAAYAALAYDILAKNHRLHHRHPASLADPDFYPPLCTGQRGQFLAWYIHFMGQYLNLKQLCWIAAILSIASAAGLSIANLLLLCILPLILSSLQLFYFGTYQPHNCFSSDSDLVSINPSPSLPWLVSLLVCYHFTYHREHHAHPDVPWWALPSLPKS